MKSSDQTYRLNSISRFRFIIAACLCALLATAGPLSGGSGVRKTGKGAALPVVKHHSVRPAVTGATGRRGSGGMSGIHRVYGGNRTAASFVVTTTADTGAGSLRKAIRDANESGGPATITFNINTAAGHTISVRSGLPVITVQTTIDGTSQPGYSGTPQIEIDGSAAGTEVNGLEISADNCIVAGLSITGFIGLHVHDADSTIFNGVGIMISSGSGNEITGNFIGMEITGSGGPGNDFGVAIMGPGTGNIIGGLSAAAQNRISDNNYSGVYIAPATSGGNSIVGNLIGLTYYQGTTIPDTVGNRQDGIFIEGPGDTVGGPLDAARNIISANHHVGIALDSLAGGTIVQNNYIGIDPQGTYSFCGNLEGGIWIDHTGPVTVAGNLLSANNGSAITIQGQTATGNIVVGNRIGLSGSGEEVLPNYNGIELDSASGNYIGSTGPGERNIISGNVANGIYLDELSSHNRIQGNILGLDAGLTLAFGNGSDGIAVAGSDNLFGGTSRAAGNLICNSDGAGISVTGGLRNTIRLNSIYANAGLGIDLAPPGVNPNGSPDAAAPNDGQNYPILDSIHYGGAGDTIYGRLPGIAGGNYLIDFYSVPQPAAAGYGPGKTWLDSIHTTAGVNDTALFLAVVPADSMGMWISAIATDQAGNSSEFSQNLRGVAILILRPLKDSLFVAGSTDTIRWSATQIDSLDILYTTQADQYPVQYTYLAGNYPADKGSFAWNPVPADVLSRKCRILLRSSSNADVSALSDTFHIKPYVLTKIDANGNYIAFDPAMDGWSFENEDGNMWPELWWQQFDYTGIDPGTQMQYPAYFPGVPYLAIPADFPDWPLYTAAFTKSQCFYTNPSTGSYNYNQKAVDYWGALKEGWGGSCSGFATTAFLCFDGYMTPPGGVSRLYSFNGPDDASRELINTYYLYQYGKAQQSYLHSMWSTTPAQTIADIKNMFSTEIRDDRILRLSSSVGAHVVNPYRLNSGPTVDSLFVYDNNYPGDRTRCITITRTGSGTWSYPVHGTTWSASGWGLFLKDPVSNALSAPVINPKRSGASPVRKITAEYSPTCMAYAFPPASVQITDASGDSIGYDASGGKWFSTMTSAHPIQSENATAGPPLGYYLPLSGPSAGYSAVVAHPSDPNVRFSFFTDSTAYSYRRTDGNSAQTDRLQFGDGMTFANTDAQSKNLVFRAIFSTAASEHLFQVTNIAAAGGDSVRIRLTGQTGLLLRNSGGSKTFDLKLINTGPSGGRTYNHAGLSVDSNTANLLVPSWGGLNNDTMKILIDHGNKGVYDDSTLVTLLGTPSVFGKTPWLDLTFGNEGVVDTFSAADQGAYTYCGAIQPDGRILAGGACMDSSGNMEFFVARYNADGTVDTAFGSQGVARVHIAGSTRSEDYAYTMALQNDGKIVLGGIATDKQNLSHPISSFGLARFTTDGRVDSTFGTGGTVRTKLPGNTNSDAAYSLLIQPDNKIVAGGVTSLQGGYGTVNSENALVRYTADGALDPSFGSGTGIVEYYSTGNTESDQTRCLVRQPDGKLIAAGISDSNFVEGLALARFDSTGTSDPSFGSSGGIHRILPDSLGGIEPFGVGLDSAGRIVLTGYCFTKKGVAGFTAVRFNTDASIDTSFGNRGYVVRRLSKATGTYDMPACGTMQADGRILVAGQAGDSAGHEAFAIERYTPDGAPDVSFGSNGAIIYHIGTTSGEVSVNEVRWIGIQSDSKIVAVGLSTQKYRPLQHMTTNSSTIVRFMPQSSFLVDGVKKDPRGIPEEFALYQNYPNPFNPSTTIRYTLAVQSRVRLTVYNILGQEIATLVDGIQPAGGKEVRWNASSGASGVYFYRLSAAGTGSAHRQFVQVRKMIFVK